MDFSLPRYRKDDLNNGFFVTQDTKGFCFGIDSVLLAHFAADNIKKKSEAVCDLCCGSGVVGIIMLSVKRQLKITGVELQPESAALCEFNIRDNALQDSYSVINEDLRYLDISLNGSFGAVVVNPPYFRDKAVLKPEREISHIARSEEGVSLEHVLSESAKLLKDKGRLFMVHKANRLADIFCLMRKYRLEPKTVRSVHSKKNRDASLVLISASKNGGEWVDIKPPLIIYNEDGSYTDEIYEIYGMNRQISTHGERCGMNTIPGI